MTKKRKRERKKEERKKKTKVEKKEKNSNPSVETRAPVNFLSFRQEFSAYELVAREKGKTEEGGNGERERETKVKNRVK